MVVVAVMHDGFILITFAHLKKKTGYRLMEGVMDGRTGGQTIRRIDGQTERQMVRETLIAMRGCI